MNYLYIGKLVNTHGIKGEVRILSNFRHKDKVFVKGFKFYVGKDKKEAKSLLEHFKIEYSKTGEKVISQSPKAGERLEDGGTVSLLLGD